MITITDPYGRSESIGKRRADLAEMLLDTCTPELAQEIWRWFNECPQIPYRDSDGDTWELIDNG